MWSTSGVVMDAGRAAGGPAGTQLSEIGITNTGTPFCITDAPTTGPYHQLCLGANVASGGGVLTYTSYMGAPVLPLTCTVNGITISNCLSAGSGDVRGPSSAILNNLPSFADTTGVLLKDSGFSSSLLNPFAGDTGAGGTAGIVPAPPAGSAAALKFLKADGTWATTPTSTPATITLTGVVTGGGTGTINTTFAASSVTNATLAPMPANTIKGNNTVGLTNPSDLTVAQATAMLNSFVGDAGGGGTKGLVPAPAAGDAAANKILTANGAWTLPSVVSGVTWPTSASIVISNSTNTPAGLAPVNNRLVYATGGAWAALASANNAVLVTSGAGVPSISSTLPSGLTIPDYAALAGATFLGVLDAGGGLKISGVTVTLPVSVPNGGTGLASGTSGGILAFTGSTTIVSSAALTANAPVIGGGAGAAPTVGTRSGNTTTFATTSGTLINGNCVAIDVNGNLVDSGGACGGSGGSGTVTSVSMSVPASSIFAVSGVPIVNSGTIVLTTTGTSGGIPYFSSGTQLSSSAVLTANAPVIGGGAGVAPNVGSRTGTTTSFATSSGTLTSGNLVSWDSNGNAIASGVVASNVTTLSGTQTVTGDKTLSGATTLSGTVSGAALTTYLASPAAIGGTTAASGRFTTLTATGTLTTAITGSIQCVQVSSTGVLSGAGGTCNVVTWPANGSLVLSNTTNTPAGLAPVANALVFGAAGPAWSALSSAANAVLVTSGASVPSFSTTLPTGLTIPGFAPLASPVFTGTPVAPTAAQGINTTQIATTAFVKLQQQGAPVSWIGGQNPNNAPIMTANQPLTVKAIVGRVEIANGTAATVTVNKAPSGTTCALGTVQHTGSFNANGTAATNQTLTLAGGAANNLAIGDTLCLQTSGGANWTSGSAIGGLTVFYSPQ